MRNLQIVLLYFIIGIYNVKAQKLSLHRVDTFENIHINKAFTTSNDVISIQGEEIFWLHNANRPLGLKKDSLVLLRINRNGKIESFQHIKTPKESNISGMVSLVINEKYLYLVEYMGVHVFEKKGTRFIFKEFTKVGDYLGRDNGQYGLYKMWHKTDKGVVTSDFQRDYQTEDGCKKMFIGVIDDINQVIIDTFRQEVCAVYFNNYNSVYPISVSPTGNHYAIADILNNKVKIYEISENNLMIDFELELSDSTWDKLNKDSLALWWQKVETLTDKDGVYRSKATREILTKDYTNKLYFLNDSVLFAYIGRTNNDFTNNFVKLININSKKVYNISSKDCKDWSHLSFANYSTYAFKNTLYILTPNTMEITNPESPNGKKNYEIRGWVLAQIKLVW